MRQAAKLIAQSVALRPKRPGRKGLKNLQPLRRRVSQMILGAMGAIPITAGLAQLAEQLSCKQ